MKIDAESPGRRTVSYLPTFRNNPGSVFAPFKSYDFEYLKFNNFLKKIKPIF